jgi:PHD/YefM family antitoxin component YafN of YafNO toxin-antitoxin module
VEACYVVDENGKRVSVILPTEEYERLAAELEDLEDARAVDQARAAVARRGRVHPIRSVKGG